MKKTLKVCAKVCNECLFSQNRLILDWHAQEIIDNCLKQDRFFICHKFNLLPNSTNDPVCCKGFYDRHKRDVLPIRLAEMLNAVEFVEVPTEKLNDSL